MCLVECFDFHNGKNAMDRPRTIGLQTPPLTIPSRLLQQIVYVLVVQHSVNTRHLFVYCFQDKCELNLWRCCTMQQGNFFLMLNQGFRNLCVGSNRLCISRVNNRVGITEKSRSDTEEQQQCQH